jgi:hypothetical protein
MIFLNRVVADNLSGDPDVRNYAKFPGKEPSEIYGEWRRGQVEMGVAKNGMTFHFFRRWSREIDSDIYTSLILPPCANICPSPQSWSLHGPFCELRAPLKEPE